MFNNQVSFAFVVEKILFFLIIILLFSCGSFFQPASAEENAIETTIADHEIMKMLYLEEIPESAIQAAIDSLQIGYGHTSHGSQITTGMSGLISFANNNWSYSNDLFTWSHDGSAGLFLFEGSGYNDGYLDHDCGNTGWDDKTRTFLNDVNKDSDSNNDCNVIMWSWCGQVGTVNIYSHYLNRMAALESEYPDVTFIYMTGHLNGGTDNAEENNVLKNNNAIRDYCRTNKKWLFDFADIEKYDLSDAYYGDKRVNDACEYDSNNDESRDANWAIDWQDAHTEGTEWFSCSSAHSQPINANQKAYAVWWLFTRIAGWDG